MRAMILAAGRGERMGELTKQIPKPLLKILDKYLIEYAIEHIVAAGITEIVINISYLAEQIQSALGDGSRYGAQFYYSVEENRLETGGGIVKALPLLGDEPFLVMSSDIITDYPLKILPKEPQGLAHLVMVDNPSFKPQGDFGLQGGYADFAAKPALTFANIGVYRPELFYNAKPEYFPLNQLLFPAIKNRLVTGEHFSNNWHNVGSPAELNAVVQYLNQ